MQWSDEAIVLGGRRFGEGGLILDVLTATKGRRRALVHGGASRKRRGQYEPGNTVALTWKGRLEEQLGRFDVAEATKERANRLLEDKLALAALRSVTTLLREGLDDGDSVGSNLFGPTAVLLDQLTDKEVWPALYVRWELGMLAALGFGLDLDTCALSGETDGLTHVSPNTGRAVCGSEAEEYLERLLVLPPFLIDANAPLNSTDVLHGLQLTGFFIEARIFNSLNRSIPDARKALVRIIRKAG